MGGEEDFNTVQCLRGRLLAERHASKVANEEVESICIKLTLFLKYGTPISSQNPPFNSDKVQSMYQNHAPYSLNFASKPYG
ncbi:uncharacterized protein G2W53_024016 [Senna tora]|uniref:Uncharacterized protein n=1 Tax=Senna tora TaxID=362788 RepID=A0A834TC47_9FABA|nr:uncharacterized protein G2W53_024016 [Senna tora]